MVDLIVKALFFSVKCLIIDVKVSRPGVLLSRWGRVTVDDGYASPA